MTSEGSVICWLDALQAGDPAAQRLWERYFLCLVELACNKLRDAPRRSADEEDMALSAFDSFFRNAEKGRFPQLTDRDGLWRLLVVITARKTAHLLCDQGCQKRGGAAAVGGSEEECLDRVLDREPDPGLAAEVAEECRRLLRQLGDGDLESIAVWRMEGCTVEEIAARLECALRTIKRKLQLIRGIWEKEGAP
jgi:DNA-directed RNA polymerase specialized sigma24 family protein